MSGEQGGHLLASNAVTNSLLMGVCALLLCVVFFLCASLFAKKG